MTASYVSVIIPTYNRYESLLHTLDSLSCQTIDKSCFEVIVVDDGSTDETRLLNPESFPILVKSIRQANQGDAVARNTGAQASEADVLIFLDDDITVAPGFVASLAAGQAASTHRLVIGTLVTVSAGHIREKASRSLEPTLTTATDLEEIDFTHCLSGILSIRRNDYLQLGMMQPLTARGSSLWCDVELAYRAHLQGYTFWQSQRAIGYHHDLALESLRAYRQRIYRVGKAAVLLFQKHPELAHHLPMFNDKFPIAWRQDPPLLIARKTARRISSTRLGMWSLEQLEELLKNRHLVSSDNILSRGLLGAELFRGYRTGLTEYGESAIQRQKGSPYA